MLNDDIYCTSFNSANLQMYTGVLRERKDRWFFLAGSDYVLDVTQVFVKLPAWSRGKVISKLERKGYSHTSLFMESMELRRCQVLAYSTKITNSFIMDEQF